VLKGSPQAEFNLGDMFAKGEGVARNDIRAFALMDLAAERYPPGPLRDDTVKNRDLVAQRLTPEGLADARNLKEALAPHPPVKK
jgi:hypothetical protein